MYYNNLAALKAAHKKLYSSRGSKAVVERHVGSRRPGLSIIEATLRVLRNDRRLADLAAGFFVELQEEFGSGSAQPFEVLCKV